MARFQFHLAPADEAFSGRFPFGVLHPAAISDVTIPALLAILWRRNGGIAASELAQRCRAAFGIEAPVA